MSLCPWVMLRSNPDSRSAWHESFPLLYMHVYLLTACQLHAVEQPLACTWLHYPYVPGSRPAVRTPTAPSKSY